MPGAFPTVLLQHAVKVYRKATAYTNGEPVESLTLLQAGAVACCISEVQSARGQNEQDGAIVQTATLTGTNTLLSGANLVFEVVKGPFDVGTRLFPVNGMSPHGLTAGITKFWRWKVETVANG